MTLRNIQSKLWYEKNHHKAIFLYLFRVQDKIDAQFQELEKNYNETKTEHDSYEKEIKQLKTSLETEKTERKEVSYFELFICPYYN